MIKVREFPESNYRSIYFNGKSIRIALDPSKPITELEYPEFYDVKITGFCKGKCPWCYMDSKETDEHYMNAVEKITSYFGPLTENQRPFQVAIGGGEPTSHPFFEEILEAFHGLGITPNYTTNGMFAGGENDYSIIQATKKYCGGVAVSCHPHLRKHWEKAAAFYNIAGVKLNFHLIISDRKSIDEFKEIYDEWKDKVEYFVLLPYGSLGRASHKDIDRE